MKKQFLAIVIFILSLNYTASAQKGNNAIGFGPEVGLPLGDFGDLCKVGFGGYLKGLYGVGGAGQLTFTWGYTSYRVKEDWLTGSGVDKVNMRIMPFLFGYRHNVKSFFLEPQLGYGLFSAKASVGNVSGTDSEGAFTFGVGAGFGLGKGFEFGTSFQAASKDGSTDSWLSFRLGYNISSKK